MSFAFGNASPTAASEGNASIIFKNAPPMNGKVFVGRTNKKN